MLIGDRLRAFREAKKLSQGDIEKRTGLLRSYISRVENGHTIPSVETLEKWARRNLQIPGGALQDIPPSRSSRVARPRAYSSATITPLVPPETGTTPPRSFGYEVGG